MTHATATAHAEGPPPIPEVEHDPAARFWVGLITFLVSEFALFSAVIVAYLFIAFDSASPVPKGVLSLQLPMLETVFLFGSTVALFLGIRSLSSNIVGTFTLAWIVAAILISLFLATTGMEWFELIYDKGLTIRSSRFGSGYYILLGLHASHVVGGLFAILVLIVMALCQQIDINNMLGPKLLMAYWLFVNAIWIIVFSVVYLISTQVV